MAEPRSVASSMGPEVTKVSTAVSRYIESLKIYIPSPAMTPHNWGTYTRSVIVLGRNPRRFRFSGSGFSCSVELRFFSIEMHWYSSLSVVLLRR